MAAGSKLSLTGYTHRVLVTLAILGVAFLLWRWLHVFLLVFGAVFILGKLASRRLGGRVRKSVVGPLDRVLGGGFGALKGLIGATLLYLALNFVYDMLWGRAAARPEWIANSRTYPLLHASGETVTDLVEARRGTAPEEAPAEANAQNAQ